MNGEQRAAAAGTAKIIGGVLAILMALWAVLAPLAAADSQVEVKITTDASVDTSSFATILAGVIKPGMTDEQKNIALFNWFERTLFHRGTPDDVNWNPHKVINVYGGVTCGTQGCTMAALCRAAGFEARVTCDVNGGHTYYEVKYGGTWHGFDTMNRFYVYNRATPRQIASFAEIDSDPTLVMNAVAEGRACPAYLYHGDDPAGYVSTSHPVLDYTPIQIPGLETLSLVPGEQITWNWFNTGKIHPSLGTLGMQHSCSKGLDATNPINYGFWEPYYYLTPGCNPEQANRRIYGNGEIDFAPDLTSSTLPAGFTQLVNLAGPGLTPIGTQPGSATFTLHSPYLLVAGTLKLKAAPGANLSNVAVSVTRDGANWSPIAAAFAPDGSLDLTAEVVNGCNYNFGVKLTLPNNQAAVAEYHLNLVFMHNKYVRPFLQVGNNQVTFSTQNPADLPGHPVTVEYAWQEGPNWDASAVKTATQVVSSAATSTWNIAVGGTKLPRMKTLTLRCGGGPTITTQPASQTITLPAAATFTVAANGSGLTYQWFKNNNPITGATSASYTTPATSLADTGSQFRVAVTNAGGSVSSSVATLTVVAAGSPVITSQPASQSVTEPAAATFTVVATGATSYQWKRNGSSIAGATAASYTTAATAVAADNGAQYTVAVTNASGTVTSASATLTVTAAGGAPTTLTLQEGASSYTGTLDTYLDAFDPANSFGTVNHVEVRNWDGGATENNIALLRFDLSDIPTNATITAATLDLWVIRANSVGTADQLLLGKVTSAWSESTTYNDGVPTSVSSGVTPPTVTIASASPVSPAVQYTVSGMNSLVQGWVATPTSNLGMMLTCGSNINFGFASSEHATAAQRPRLTVTYTTAGGGTAPAITTHPANQTVTAPATASFSVAATGATGYQWQRNGTNIAGATAASYTTAATSVATDNGAVYRVLVSNASGTTTSNPATLTVNPAVGTAPVITTQPASQTVTAPATASFSVAATGATGYQWQRNGTNIAGATAASYTTAATSVATDNGAVYRVLVSNASGTTTSNPATLTVQAASAGNPITPSATTVTLAAPTGSTTTVTRTITLVNTSGGPITITPATSCIWLSTSGTLTIPAGSTATLTVTGDPTGLDGSFVGTVTLSNSTGGSQTVAVSFVVGTQASGRQGGCAVASWATAPGITWLLGLVALAGVCRWNRNRSYVARQG